MLKERMNYNKITRSIYTSEKYDKLYESWRQFRGYSTNFKNVDVDHGWVIARDAKTKMMEALTSKIPDRMKFFLLSELIDFAGISRQVAWRFLNDIDPSEIPKDLWDELVSRVPTLWNFGLGDTLENLPIYTEKERFDKSLVEGSKYNILFFYAQGCYACSDYFEVLNKAVEKYNSEELAVIAFSLDPTQKIFEEYKMKMQIRFPTYCDFGGWNSKNAEHYGVRSIPKTCIVDKKGSVIYTRLEHIFIRDCMKSLLN